MNEPLVYESNPKHSEPWQVGKRGSLCEADVRPLAQNLLADSVEFDGKRYAVHQGRAYCAQEHAANRWHGYPIGWMDVPAKLAWKWVKDGVLTKRDRRKYWEAH
jgi:hypothetical protein